jgi:hypothetical protein
METQSLLDKILNYLETNHPDIADRLTSEEIAFIRSLTEGPSARVLVHAVAHNDKLILGSVGHEILGYKSEEDWSFPTYLLSIPFGYGILHEAYAWETYRMFYENRLKRHNIHLRFEKETIVQDASGVMHRATQWGWIVASKPDSTPVITVSIFILHDTWNLDLPPVVLKPRIFLGNERLFKLEEILIDRTLQTCLLNDFELSKKQLFNILYLLAKGKSNGEISRELGFNTATVPFYNLKIIETFHNKFSRTFQSAAECARFTLLLAGGSLNALEPRS